MFDNIIMHTVQSTFATICTHRIEQIQLSSKQNLPNRLFHYIRMQFYFPSQQTPAGCFHVQIKTFDSKGVQGAAIRRMKRQATWQAAAVFIGSTHGCPPCHIYHIPHVPWYIWRLCLCMWPAKLVAEHVNKHFLITASPAEPLFWPRLRVPPLMLSTWAFELCA